MTTTTDPLKNMDYFEALDKYRRNFVPISFTVPYSILIGTPDTLQLVKAMYSLNARDVRTTTKISSWQDQAVAIHEEVKAEPNFMFWAMYDNFSVPSSLMQEATAICSVSSNPITINWIKNRIDRVHGNIPEIEAKKEEAEPVRPLKEYDLLPPPSAEYQAAISRWMGEDNDWDY